MFPSPKFQYQLTIVPSESYDESLNDIRSSDVGLFGLYEKFAIGGRFDTGTILVVEFVAISLSVMVSVTL